MTSNIEGAQKKRGRPPSKVNNKQLSTKKKVSLSPDNNKMIIMELPNSDSFESYSEHDIEDVAKDNNKKETNIGDIENEPKIEIISQVNKHQDTKFESEKRKHHFTEELSETCSIKSTDYPISYYKSELNKKDLKIKHLEEEIDKYNMDGFVKKSINSIKNQYYNLNLIHDKTKENVSLFKNKDLCCWWCTYNFENLPVYLPVNFVDNKYYVMGYFCSFNCAASYNFQIGDNGAKTRETLLKQQFYKVFSEENVKFEYAPKKEILQKFGGPIDIETYRTSFYNMNEQFYLHLPPMNPMIYNLEITNTENY